MTRFFVWKARHFGWAILILILAFFIWQMSGDEGMPVFSVKKSSQQTKEFYIITTEYKTTLENGKEMEVYRWNPGNIIVNKGDRVTLRIIGVHGKAHPFIIKGLNVNGEVTKGGETTVRFVAEEAGVYPMICLVHNTIENHGPMIAYIHVLE